MNIRHTPHHLVAGLLALAVASCSSTPAPSTATDASPLPDTLVHADVAPEAMVETDQPRDEAQPMDTGCATDDDGDGVLATSCGGTDCDDSDPRRFPGNAEVCDTMGHDEDCNPCTVASATTGDGDGDTDTFVSIGCFNTFRGVTPMCDPMLARVDGAMLRVTGRDCDDANNNVQPDQTETCNGLDDNCNGAVDEGVLRTFYRDADGDGFGDRATGAVARMACALPMGYAENNSDCDDAAQDTNPGAREVCDADMRDENCAMGANEGCTCIEGRETPCPEQRGLCAASVQRCVAGRLGTCSYVAADERCDGFDNDCDGEVDEGLAAFMVWPDADRDGDGDASAAVRSNCRIPTGYVDNNRDCDDHNDAVRTGVSEQCDGIDNNCNGRIDEGVTVIGGCMTGLSATCAAGDSYCGGGRALDANGFIADWALLGLFDSPSVTTTDQLDTRDLLGGESMAAPSVGATTMGRTWTEWRAAANPVYAVCRGVDLSQVFATAARPVPTNATAYLFAYVYSPADRVAELALGCDDGCRAWLNGAQVASRSTPSGCTADDIVVSVRLTAGANRLLLKVTNGAGPSGGTARFRWPGAGGAPMRDLSVGIALSQRAQRCGQRTAPEAERCDNMDNNCDGRVDETCACTVGMTRSYYTGAAGTQAVSPCHAGTQRCNSNPDGSASWGVMDPELTPVPEICGNSRDDNCNGVTDEDVSCPAHDSATYACRNVVGCVVATCAADHANCDGNAANGCETTVRGNPSNCGSCGNRCATGNCVGLSCSSGCPAGERMCSGVCTDTSFDQRNCGACGRTCTVTRECVNGQCLLRMP